MSDQTTLYLLMICGTLSPKTLELARKVHNMTAGILPVSLRRNRSGM